MKIEPEEFAEAAANFLGIARKHLQPIVKSDIRRAYILGQLETIEALTRDILILEDRARGTSSSILVRSLCDCMYSLVAASENADFAPAKLIYEMESDAKRLKKGAAYETGSDQAQSLKEADGLLQRVTELRKKYPSVQNKNWKELNSRGCAEEAKLLKHYYTHYSHFSRFTHTDLVSLILTGLGTGRSGRLRHTILILIKAIESLPKAFSSKSLVALKTDRDQLHALMPQVQVQLSQMSDEEYALARAKLKAVDGTQQS